MRALQLLLLVAITLWCVKTTAATYVRIDPVTGQLSLIDVTTYFLPDTPKLPAGIWPSGIYSFAESAACYNEVDAQYDMHSGLYIIDDWAYFEDDFGAYGGVAVKIDVVDLQAFTATAAAWPVNTWSGHPVTCDDVWMRISTGIIAPLIDELSAAIKRENGYKMEVINYGLHYQILCRTNNTDDYALCDSLTFMKIFKAAPYISEFFTVSSGA